MSAHSSPSTSLSAETKAASAGNREQREAILHASGPCLVLAGPGSGKTFVLIRHIRHLTEALHVPQEKLLVLTFSRAAAVQMRERYERETGAESRITFGTFHSVFYRLLKRVQGENRLVTDQDTEPLLAQIIRRYTGDAPPEMDEVRLAMTLARAVGEEKCDPSLSFADSFPMILGDYERALRGQGWIDFDGILLTFLSLLRENTVFRRQLQQRYTHVLVDEFQDINPVQYEILKLLAGGAGNLFGVGDDDQSIYAFRGSSPDICRRFLTDYPDAHRVVLRVNYRCSADIVLASSLVVRENKNRLEKRMQAKNASEVPVRLIAAENERREEEAVAAFLKSLPPSKRRCCTLLFRTNTQLQHFRKVLDGSADKGKAPSKSFPCSEIAGDLCAYLLCAEGVCAGAIPLESFSRILNRPNRLLFPELPHKRCLTRKEILSAVSGAAGRRAVQELLDDLSLLGRVRPGIGFRYLLGTLGYAAYAKDGISGEALRGLEAFLETLQEAAEQSESLPAFLEKIEEAAAAERLREENQTRKPAPPSSEGGPRLMTMHASKGLEFDTVLLPYCTEGRLPNRSAKSENEIEEERRLFYVAMTRAKHALLLFYAENPAGPSRFLDPLLIRPAGKKGGAVLTPPGVRLERAEDFLRKLPQG